MTITDIFQLAIDFKGRGNIEMTLGLLKEVSARDFFFGPAHYELGDFYFQTGNLGQSKNEYIHFLNSPVTGVTIELIGQARTRITEIDKKMGLQPVLPPAPVPNQK